jgi:hypothetical protein
MLSKLASRAAVGALLVAMWGGAAAARATVDSGAAPEAPAQDARTTLTGENGVRAAPSGHVEVTALTAGPGRRQAIARPAVKSAARPVVVAAKGAASRPRIAQVQPDRLSLLLEQVAEPEVLQDKATQTPAEAQAVAQADAGFDGRTAVYRRAGAPNPAEGEPELLLARNQRSGMPAPPVRSQPEPPQDARQHVAFPRRSAEAAAAFDGYMHAVAAIDASFKSGAGVAAALKTGAGYDPRQLEEGMVAYGAMAALQSPRFVYGVMDAAADEQDRRDLVERLLAEPDFVTRLTGAEDAAALAGAALLEQASPVLSAGKALKQASYDVQHQPWSIARAPDQSGRLAQAKAISSRPASAGDQDMARLMTRISAAPNVAGRDRQGIAPAAARSLALAALSILDAADTDDARLDQLVFDKSSADCLRLAKLNLFQCLSVAGPEYENVYCLGQHAVLDTGQCVAGAASTAGPLAMSQPGPRMSRIPGLNSAGR